MSKRCTKKLPTCIIFQCDYCPMSYGVNHNFVAFSSLFQQEKHICPDCYEEYGNELQEAMAGYEVNFIPMVDYTPFSPAKAQANGIP